MVPPRELRERTASAIRLSPLVRRRAECGCLRFPEGEQAHLAAGSGGAGAYDPIVYAKHVHLQSLPAGHTGRPVWEIAAAVAAAVCALVLLVGLHFVPDRQSRPARPSAG
jgi:hypothetical protein